MSGSVYFSAVLTLWLVFNSTDSETSVSIRLSDHHSYRAEMKETNISSQKLDMLLIQFRGFDQNSTEYEIAQCLDSLRVYSKSSLEAGKTIVGRLRESDPVFQNRGSKEVIRLRSYMMASLGHMTAPVDAIPYLVTELNHNQKGGHYMVAAAARAASGLEQHQKLLTPLLGRYLNPEEMDDHFDLDNYYKWPPIKPTSVKCEVLKTLISYGASAKSAFPDIERAYSNMFDASNTYQRDPELAFLLKEAMNSVNLTGNITMCGETDAQHSLASLSLVNDFWRAPAERNYPDVMNITMIDTENRIRTISNYKGKPFALTFFYSRCGNYNKCSMTVSRLAQLEKSLNQHMLGHKVNLIGISLDPYYDTPDVIQSFAEVRGIDLSQSLQLLKVQNPEDQEQLSKGLDIPVSYQGGMVGVHGIEILLFDKKGRFVRRYLNSNWTNAQLIAKFQILINEPTQ